MNSTAYTTAASAIAAFARSSLSWISSRLSGQPSQPSCSDVPNSIAGTKASGNTT